MRPYTGQSYPANYEPVTVTYPAHVIREGLERG